MLENDQLAIGKLANLSNRSERCSLEKAHRHWTFPVCLKWETVKLCNELQCVFVLAKQLLCALTRIKLSVSDGRDLKRTNMSRMALSGLLIGINPQSTLAISGSEHYNYQLDRRPKHKLAFGTNLSCRRKGII